MGLNIEEAFIYLLIKYQTDVRLHGSYQNHLAFTMEIDLMDQHFVLRIQASHAANLIFQCPKTLKSLNVIQNTPFRYDRSRIVIYDGPRFQMPQLSPYKNNFNLSYYVSSAFQIVLVHIFIDENFLSQIK